MIKLLIAFLLSFVLSLILMPIIMRIFKRKKASQTILGYVENHKDKNGTLDIHEFISLVRFMEKKAYDDDPFVVLFDKCDIDGNGVLDIVEFCLVWKCVVPDIDTDTIVNLFKAADDDGNGVVDFNEYMELVAQVKKELKI